MTIPLTNKHFGYQFSPVTIPSEAVAACTTVHTADGNYKQPEAIDREACALDGNGTGVQMNLRYKTAVPVTTDVVVRLYGLTDAGVPYQLLDEDGTGEWTLTATVETDPQDLRGNSYTPPVEIDCKNNKFVKPVIVTALEGGGTPIEEYPPAIMLRIL